MEHLNVHVSDHADPQIAPCVPLANASDAVAHPLAAAALALPSLPLHSTLHPNLVLLVPEIALFYVNSVHSKLQTHQLSVHLFDSVPFLTFYFIALFYQLFFFSEGLHFFTHRASQPAKSVYLISNRPFYFFRRYTFVPRITNYHITMFGGCTSQDQ